jgi:hypothetical protein
MNTGNDGGGATSSALGTTSSHMMMGGNSNFKKKGTSHDPECRLDYVVSIMSYLISNLRAIDLRFVRA